MDMRKYAAGLSSPTTCATAAIRKPSSTVSENDHYGRRARVRMRDQFSCWNNYTRILNKAWGYESDNWLEQELECLLGITPTRKPIRRKETVNYARFAGKAGRVRRHARVRRSACRRRIVARSPGRRNSILKLTVHRHGRSWSQQETDRTIVSRAGLQQRPRAPTAYSALIASMQNEGVTWTDIGDVIAMQRRRQIYRERNAAKLPKPRAPRASRQGSRWAWRARAMAAMAGHAAEAF